MVEERTPASEHGQVDAGDEPRESKPCCKRVVHGNVLAVSLITWCTLPDGHPTSIKCVGPIPWPLALGPRTK